MNEISRKIFLNPPQLYIHENGYVDLDPHWHSDLSLDPYSCFYLVEAGEGFLIHNGERIEMKPGNAYLIPPNTPFSYGCPSRLVKLYIHFNMVGSDGLDVLRHLGKIHTCPLLEGELSGLLSLYPKSSLSDAYAFRHLLYGVIARMLATYPADQLRNKSYSPLVSRAMKYIQENLSVGLSLAEVASSLFVAEVTLRKHFKKEMGLTPRAYIEDLVLLEAELLLKNTGLTVAEIAARLGFCDQFYFTRRFTLRYRISPREYRLRAKK